MHEAYRNRNILQDNILHIVTDGRMSPGSDILWGGRDTEGGRRRARAEEKGIPRGGSNLKFPPYLEP